MVPVEETEEVAVDATDEAEADDGPDAPCGVDSLLHPAATASRSHTSPDRDMTATLRRLARRRRGKQAPPAGTGRTGGL